MADDSDIARVKALRDFFASMDAADIQAAACSISNHFNMPLDDEVDWVAVEYDFNRLFVGPMAVPAPPYASAYQDEPMLMGKATLKVRAAFREMGLAVPEEGTTPDDHLAFELDAVVAIDAIAQAGGGGAEFSAMHAWFVHEYMGDWVPRFVEATKSQKGVTAPIAMATDALQQWLGEAQAATSR